MKAKSYNHLKIEKKWQKIWDTEQTYKTETNSTKKKMYVLDMFPYPSGVGLHVGHPRGYIGSDVYARLKRMQGFNVLHPMGFDSFGLPAEQYAIQTKKHPAPFTEKLVKSYSKQLESIGFSYDWSRMVATHRPEYYKWTQWIFLKIYNSFYDTKKNKARPIEELVAAFEKNGNEKVDAMCDSDTVLFSKKQWVSFSPKEQQDMLMKYRLAYEGFAEVNWCAELGTVLANDEILDSPTGPVSERGGYPVIKKPMRQWFMRITAYGGRLIEDLDTVDYPQKVKTRQINWIGKSEGSEIYFPLTFSAHPAFNANRDAQGNPARIPVFTTRADTLFGATYMVLAPEHPWVTLALDTNHDVLLNKAEVKAYVENVKNKTEIDRTNDDKEKTGVELKGVKAINPANQKEIPIYVADYVLAHYGTGAVMAVPAHDERDFAFAKKYGLQCIQVISPENSAQYDEGKPWTEYGKVINSDQFNGITSEEAKKGITEFVGGKIVTRYKMRDAIFARQRYWGEPIPLKHDRNGIITPVKEKELPLELPNVKSYAPSGNGESPLAGVKSWVDAGYETNTMPGWAGSSWYFLRYMDPTNTKEFAGEKALEYWKQVDMYVGGNEHDTGHVLYARFWHKVLYDLGYVPVSEPFKSFRNQGMIGGPDGRKMSKRWGNVINPDDVVKTYGADTLRVYEMFMGPFEASLPWSTESIIGARRFIERVWRLSEKIQDSDTSSPSVIKILHKTIKKVSEDIESFSFNTAISSLMICLNDLEKAQTQTEAIAQKDFNIFLQLLAPFAPHMTDELWHHGGEEKSIHISPWPKYDPKLLLTDTVTVGVQVNGKVRAELTYATDATPKEIEHIALELPNIQKHLEGKLPKKVIVVPGRIINIVL